MVRPRDGERMADIGNEANTKLSDEHSSNSLPRVVNVSKVILSSQLPFPSTDNTLGFHAAGTSR